MLERERGLLSQLPYRPHGAMSKGAGMVLYLSHGTTNNKDGTSNKLSIQAHTNMTVLDLLRVAAHTFNHPESLTDLIWSGGILRDGAQTMEMLGLTDGAVVGVRLRKEDSTKSTGSLEQSQHTTSDAQALPSLVLSSNPNYIATLFELLSMKEVPSVFGSRVRVMLYTACVDFSEL